MAPGPSDGECVDRPSRTPDEHASSYCDHPRRTCRDRPRTRRPTARGAGRGAGGVNPAGRGPGMCSIWAGSRPASTGPCAQSIPATRANGGRGKAMRSWRRRRSPPEEIRLAEVSEAGGRSSLRTLDTAVDLATAGTVDGVLFGPFNKASLHLAGMDAEDEHRYIAHHIGFTGHHSEVNMLDELMTTRVTSHIALKDVVENITITEVVKAIRLAQDTLSAAGVSRPRIGVAAINPMRGTTAISAPRKSTSWRRPIEKARGVSNRRRRPLAVRHRLSQGPRRPAGRGS